jgi:hypothetical protein
VAMVALVEHLLCGFVIGKTCSINISPNALEVTGHFVVIIHRHHILHFPETARFQFVEWGQNQKTGSGMTVGEWNGIEPGQYRRLRQQ